MTAILLMIFAMAGVLASWLVLGAVFCGLGLGLQRALGRRGTDARRLLMSFWMGLAFVVVFLQIWHLLLPIRWPATAIVSVMGLSGLIWNRRAIGDWLRRYRPQRKAALIPMAIAAIWLANRAIQSCTTYDSGLYHLNAVRWAAEHPIIPGLGNLHYRLAFNNANFLVAAMLEVGPWHGRSNHLLNGLLLAAVFAQCILGAFRLMREDHEQRTTGLFDLLLLTGAILTAVHSWTSSHATETPVTAVAFVAGSALFAFLLAPRGNLSEQAHDVIFIAAMLSLGICLKLTLGVFAVIGMPVALAFWIVRARRTGRRTLGTVLVAIGGSSLLIVPWLLRSVILSGYPLLPSTFGAVAVEWRVPGEMVAEARYGIAAWARCVRQLDGWSWLGPWASQLDREILLPVIMATAGAAVLVCARILHRPASGRASGGWWVVPPVCGAIVFWFFTAPSPRFGAFLFWLLAAGITATAFHRLAVQASRRTLTWILLGCLVLAACNVKKGFRLAGGDWGFGPTPKVRMLPFRTSSGLTLWVPAKGNQCWDSPLPATPYPNKNLRLRRAGKPGSGFVMGRQAAEEH